MQFIINEDTPGCLGVPYGTRPERMWYNLKRDPQLLHEVPELRDCPTLADAVASLNREDSRFLTFGCEKWYKAYSETLPNGIAGEFASYIDFAFDAQELACNPTNYDALFEDLRVRAESSAEAPFSITNVEKKRLALYDVNYGGWIGSVWVSGAGGDEPQARSYWATALATVVRWMHASAATIPCEMWRKSRRLVP